MNYSVTQATNIAAFIGALTIFIPLATKLLTAPLEMTGDDWTQIGASGTVVVTTIISFVNRYRKGDVTLAGSIRK